MPARKPGTNVLDNVSLAARVLNATLEPNGFKNATTIVFAVLFLVIALLPSSSYVMNKLCQPCPFKFCPICCMSSSCDLFDVVLYFTSAPWWCGQSVPVLSANANGMVMLSGLLFALEILLCSSALWF